MTDKGLEPWRIREADFPTLGTTAERLRALVDYAILAPSSHNSQPWLFGLGDGQIDLFADRSRACPVIDPDDRQLVMSCGAALLNLRVAARHFGYTPEVELCPQPDNGDLIARFRLGLPLPPTPEEDARFQAITRRRTSRHAYSDQPVAPELLGAMTRAAAEEGATLHVVSADQRPLLADLTAEADRVQGRDPRFRRELAAWVNPNRARSCDGMPASAVGLTELAPIVGPLVIRTFDMGRGTAARDRALTTAAGAIIVLATERDDLCSWAAAGQALERVLLDATAAGVSSSFLNQAVELPDMRARLREKLSLGSQPQAIVRLGFGPPDVSPTPRRAVEDVLRA